MFRSDAIKPAQGVGQTCKFRADNVGVIFDPLSRARSLRSRNCSGVPGASIAVGVPHSSGWTAPASDIAPERCATRPRFTASFATGVGQLCTEEEAISPVRCSDTTSWHNGGPDGIAKLFQVITHSREPLPDSLARNLLSKDSCRAALRDEASPDRPQMSNVICTELLAGRTERLAGAASGPDFAICWPSGKSQCFDPSSDAGEEVALPEPDKVGSSHIVDAASVDGVHSKTPSSSRFCSQSAAKSSYSLR